MPCGLALALQTGASELCLFWFADVIALRTIDF